MNHCAALSGSSIVGGMSASHLEKRFTHQVRDLVYLKNSGDRASLRRTESIRVRAVSTDSRYVSVGERARRPQNVDGDFFVDRTCIDCDVCRWMAPTVYSRKDGQSAVHHQPTSDEERRKALQALLSCPTASIKTVTPPKDIRDVHLTFPLPIDPELPGVYHCGYHSERSYAATSYLIRRSEGNILVDSPRYTGTLARQIDAMGGIRYMFLTHIDDVADHKKWRSRFGCERIIHKDEVTSGTSDVEIKLDGEGTWKLGSDVELILTRGHTKGHVVLLLKDKGVLFSGDHLFVSSMSGEVTMSRAYVFFSVSAQLKSIENLLNYDFTWLLPGHGRRRKFESIAEKNAVLEDLVQRERQR